MNTEDFKAMKSRLVSRAVQVVNALGSELPGVNGPYHYYSTAQCFIVKKQDQLYVTTPTKNYLTGESRFVKIYDEVDGVEHPLGLTHKELVSQYKVALEVLDRALLLEDLANV